MNPELPHTVIAYDAGQIGAGGSAEDGRCHHADIQLALLTPWDNCANLFSIFNRSSDSLFSQSIQL
jgi:hypothetical protein